jgi:succinoglycan biosynthesis protein ExoU
MTGKTVDQAQTISVIIAVKNAQATIARAVNSALAQPEAHQILVVDDGSDDDTAGVAAACDLSGQRLTVIRLDQNRGPAAARNIALTRATGTYVCVLDSDDYMAPGRLGTLLTQSAGTDLLADDLYRALEDQPYAITGRLFDTTMTEGPLSLAQFVRGNISRPGKVRRELGFIKPLMRRAFLTQHNLAYDERLRLGEDFDLYARALAAGAVMRLTGPCGYVAVERAGSLSGQHRTADLGALLAADLRLLSLPGLSPKDRSALRDHAASIRHRYDHRLVLDARRSGGFGAALRWLAERPGSIPYIIAQTLRDKVAAQAAS